MARRQGGFSFKNLYDSDIRVAGNVRIEFYHQSSGKSKTGGSTLMFSCWLHTAFIPDKNVVTLFRKELDGAHKDKQRFDSNLQLQLHWEKLECVDNEVTAEAVAEGEDGVQVRVRREGLRRLAPLFEGLGEAVQARGPGPDSAAVLAKRGITRGENY